MPIHDDHASHPIARRSLLLGGALAAVGAAATGPASASPQGGPAVTGGGGHPRFSERTARRWARDTWCSLEAMTDPDTGLPADNIPERLAPQDRSGYTSPTNIGGLMWSAVVARELGVISARDCERLLRRTLGTLRDIEHHEASGLYYNWYDEATGEALRSWPGTGDPVFPFVSSVDNGWLGAALWTVGNAIPSLQDLAHGLFEGMRWDAFYNPGDGAGGHPVVRPGGLMHGGFFPFDHDRPGGVYQGTHIGGDPVWLTNHHYDTIVSETRITSYLALMRDMAPPAHYFASWRTFPATDDWNWHEMQPVGTTRTYEGIEVYEGAYSYRGMRIVPGWGGSMFEELMPDVFVPEERWAPRSWGRNHPLHVRAQREHGLEDAGYGYWGFSPASNPFGGYREYGLDMLGLNPDGYFSDVEMTNYDVGFGDSRPATNPDPDYGDGVVTPHAAFLAMMHEPDEAFDNLARLESDFDCYDDGGFFDAVAVGSGQIARRYLSLDQAMVMGALGNVLERDVIRRAFSTRSVRRTLQPIIGQERFEASSHR